MNKKTNLVGNKYGKLTVIKETERVKSRRRVDCLCDCGNKTNVMLSNITRRITNSCGCLKIEKTKKHGMSKSRIHNIWIGIKSRCLNKNATDYRYYGAKGVIVCVEWMKFIPFYEWSRSNGYSKALTLDRINTYGDYSPENCRWATASTQARNQRKKKTNTSGYIGAYKRGNKWMAKVGVNCKLINIGTYETLIDAAKARDQYIVDNNLLNFTMNNVLKTQ